MLTQEQIQNLKPGDTVLVEAEVSSPLSEGAVVTHGCITHALPASKLYPLPSEHGTSVPTTKHDPYRLFKKGDVARVVKRFGRQDMEVTLGELVTLLENERGVTFVGVKDKHGEVYRIAWWHLDLVTPVEELERYAVDSGDIAWFVVDRKHESGELNIAMYMNTHPNAKAAAEAERDRLNAKWRKKQK